MPNTALGAKDQKACQRCRRCETLYCNTNKGSKGYVCQRCQKWYLWLLHNIIYRVMLLMSEVLKVLFSAVYRVMLLMSEVLKLFHILCTQLYEQKIKEYVKGVERDLKYTIRTCDIFAYNFLNIQPIFNMKNFLKS